MGYAGFVLINFYFRYTMVKGIIISQNVIFVISKMKYSHLFRKKYLRNYKIIVTFASGNNIIESC